MARQPVVPCDDLRPARPGPCALVLFGATGDLTRRKLIPALYRLFLQSLLPEKFAIIAFARKPKDDTSFREDVRNAIVEYAPQISINENDWDRFSSSVFYHRSNLDDQTGYKSLDNRMNELDRSCGLGGNRLFYLATPPANFQTVIDCIHSTALASALSSESWHRIMVEKPFGIDLPSAQILNRALAGCFPEENIYRIDHYLGKETVQNILVMRFANRMFEQLWNQLHIDNVQITVSETLGMEGRGSYFNSSGIIRDIVQNHALQILTLVAMEPPISLEPDRIRDEKVKVLRSIRPFSEPIRRDIIRGQYTSGIIDGQTVPGYLDEEGIPAGSATETYLAARLYVDNWRWAGVPFYLRAGKRMACRETRVVIQLKDSPDVLFARMECADIKPNRIVLRIQPDEGMEIAISSKAPGGRMAVTPVKLKFDYHDEYNDNIPDAYERLLVNAMLGDTSLFARADEVETAWALLSPLLSSENSIGQPPVFYQAGTSGPLQAELMMEMDGRKWWD